MLRLAAFLNANGYRAAIVDPRGHGDSGGVYGFNLHEHHDTAAVANDLLQRLPIESITLIGFSYGASIAISSGVNFTYRTLTLEGVTALLCFIRSASTDETDRFIAFGENHQ